MAVPVILSTLCSCLQRLFSFMSPYQSVANLHYLPAASPNSYSSGLPLLIQPSEPGITHPQHVAAANVGMHSVALLITAAVETGNDMQNEAGWKHEGKQLNRRMYVVV